MLGLGSTIVSGGAFSKNYLLDEVRDAVGGYSLRKLRHNYTGPAVRVRRTSDDAERDIYFAADGTLDVTTLESFCSGTDGRVVRWYNQVEGEPTTPLDKSFGQSAALAFSVRQLDSGYRGPCMSVKGAGGEVGVEYTAARDGVSPFTSRVVTRTNTFFSSAETSTNSLEVWVDAPSQGDSQVQVGLRFGYKSQTVGERGMQFYPNVNQRKWTKISFDASTASGGADTKVFGQRIEAWLGGQGDYQPGDKILIRNAKMTAPSFVAPTYDETATGWQEFSDRAKIILSYDVGFDAKGNLDTDKIDAYATAYKGGVLELEVDGTLGDTDNNIGARKAFTAHTDQTTWSYEVEVYADCPSLGSSNVEFGAQSGDHTIPSSLFSPASVEQRKWTKVQFSRTGSSGQSFDNRLHFSIAGTSTPDQELADGDRVYIRAASGKCAGDSSLNWTADFSSDVDGWTEVSAGNGDDEYDDFTLSYVTDPKGAVAVTKWYDQSGAGLDVEQDTHLKMPLIYKYDSTKDDYCITESNDKAAVELSRDAYFDERAFTGNTSTGFSAFLTGNRNEQLSAASGRAIFALVPDGSDPDANSTYEVFEIASFSNILRAYRDGDEFGADPNDYTQNDFSTGSTLASQTRQYAFHVTQKADKTAVGNLDGGSNVALNDSVDHQAYDNFAIGNRWSSSGSPTSNREDVEYRLNEIVFYDEDRSGDAADIRNNLNDYYRTYSAGDAIQTTLSAQPKIVDNGTVEKVNDVEVVRFDANIFLDLQGNSNLQSDPLEAYTFYKTKSSDTTLILYTKGPNTGSYSPAVQTNDGLTLAGGYNQGNDADSLNLYANNVEFVYTDQVTDRTKMKTALKERASDLDSGSIEVHENAAVSWSGQFQVNGYTGFQLDDGRIGEMLFFDASKASERQFIQADMADHFKVKPFDAPLSQSYGSGAKTAYSLRRVNDDYRGPAIRVRNQSTDAERDIGFDAFGNLDIAGLESFANGSQLHLCCWYDQSGNGNHAVQDTEGNQPKVTDGSGNAFLENGRAQIRFENGSGPSTQDELLAKTNNSLIGLTRLDAYIAYTPVTDGTKDTNYILFNNSSGSGKFSFVIHNSEPDTGLVSGYSDANLYVNNSDVTPSYTDPKTTRAELYADVVTSAIQIEVHEDAHTLNWAQDDGNFWILGYNYRGMNGSISEILFFGEDKSSNRTDLQDNMNNYYYAY